MGAEFKLLACAVRRVLTRFLDLLTLYIDAFTFWGLAPRRHRNPGGSPPCAHPPPTPLTSTQLSWKAWQYGHAKSVAGLPHPEHPSAEKFYAKFGEVPPHKAPPEPAAKFWPPTPPSTAPPADVVASHRQAAPMPGLPRMPPPPAKEGGIMVQTSGQINHQYLEAYSSGMLTSAAYLLQVVMATAQRTGLALPAPDTDPQPAGACLPHDDLTDYRCKLRSITSVSSSSSAPQPSGPRMFMIGRLRPQCDVCGVPSHPFMLGTSPCEDCRPTRGRAYSDVSSSNSEEYSSPSNWLQQQTSLAQSVGLGAFARPLESREWIIPIGGPQEILDGVPIQKLECND